jgi:hypothetical protein
MPKVILVALTVFLASILQGFSGFGYGLALMTALPFFLPITTATILVSFSSTFISIYMLGRNWKNYDLKLIIFPLIGSFLFIPIGVFLLNYIDEDILKILLGVLLVLISIFFLTKREDQLKIKPKASKGILVGATAGTLNGILSVGGPPLVLYFIHAARDKYNYKASMDLIFLISSIYRLVWLYIYGNITSDMAPILITAVLAGVTGTVLGFNLLIKTERAVIAKAIYGIMMLAGISLIFL